MTATESSHGPSVDVGWVIAGSIDAVDVEAASAASARMLDTLQKQFPRYTWRMPIIRRREISEPAPAEPVALLEHGTRERDAMNLDFVVVVTDVELKAYFKPFALGVPSKAMNAALLSTARLDPISEGTEDRRARLDVLTRRTFALAMHLFGHMNDLPHAERPDDFMFDVSVVGDLDSMDHYSQPSLRRLERELSEEADLRLEERGRFTGRISFYIQAMRHRWKDILRTIFGARPWLFPYRLSRLTTAAVSAMLVLIMTAEAWDLGMNQPPGRVASFSVIALLGTVVYILVRQRLFLRRYERGLREQRVVSNVSTAVSVFMGMLITYVLLFLCTLLVSHLFFSGPLIESWAAALEGQIGLSHHLTFAAFIATLGIVIGALGASFEEHGYFRHITYADEET